MSHKGKGKLIKQKLVYSIHSYLVQENGIGILYYTYKSNLWYKGAKVQQHFDVDKLFIDC